MLAKKTRPGPQEAASEAGLVPWTAERASARAPRADGPAHDPNRGHPPSLAVDALREAADDAWSPGPPDSERSINLEDAVAKLELVRVPARPSAPDGGSVPRLGDETAGNNTRNAGPVLALAF